MFNLYFDGGKRQGYISLAFVVIDDKGKIVNKNSIKINTNKLSANVAEYLSLFYGLLEVYKSGIKKINIYGDSQLVIYQLQGRYGVKNKNMKYCYKLCQKMLSQFDYYKLHWIPRKYNSIADAEGR